MTKSAPADRDSKGPFDVDEVGLLTPYLDFGSIRIAPRQGLQIRADVDESSKKIVALTLELAGHRLQLQAFAASKSAGIWTETLLALETGLASQGGQSSRHNGLVGVELHAIVPVEVGGKKEVRHTRFIGVDGPRWFLRGVINSPGLDDFHYQKLIEVFRSTAVSRGDIAMPPGELLPLRLPVQDTEPVQQ
jgi:hypothetical protein